MEIWPILAVLTIIVLLALTVRWHRRAMTDEATLLSIASLVDVGDAGSDLVREVRSRVSTIAESETAAQRYCGTLDGAAIGIALFDPLGEIRYVNPVGERLLIGNGEQTVLRPRISALVQRVAQSGGIERIESDVHDPVRRVLMATGVPLRVGGLNADSVAVYIEDLSDRKRVDAMRTDFVANASHELKTPLGALSILAETLAETTDVDARSRLAGRLRSEAARMANVIDDVVRLAETESSGLEFEVVQVSDLVDSAVESVAPLAADKHIELVRGEIATGGIAASREQVTSAIRNLLENAIVYTAVKDGTGTVTFRVQRKEGMMHIEIQDTGVGIPDQYVDRVFERFFRVDRARSRESGGTGLGLSIVKNVAQAHGGTVYLTSEVGVGSLFTICIPEATQDVP